MAHSQPKKKKKNFDGYPSSFYSFHNLFEFVISYYSFTTLFFPLPIFRFSSLNPTININIFFLVSHLRLPSQTSPVYYRSKLNPKMIFSLLSHFINFSIPTWPIIFLHIFALIIKSNTKFPIAVSASFCF